MQENFQDRHYNNIVVTSFNNRKDYFRRGETLIASLHRTSFNSFDQIFIYNLGLEKPLVNRLKRYEKVTVLEYPAELHKIHDGYLDPGQFSWKCYALKQAAELGQNILWLDSGVAVLKDIAQIFEVIQREDVFFVDNGAGIYIKDWTHDFCLSYMEANENEQNGLQITANIIGYKSHGIFQHIFDEAFELSKIKDVINSNGKVHRHDQSIFSILSIRYGCRRYPFEIYGEYRGVLSKEQVFYAHRGNYWDRTGLKLSTNSGRIGFEDTVYNTINDVRINLLKGLKVAGKKILGK